MLDEIEEEGVKTRFIKKDTMPITSVLGADPLYIKEIGYSILIYNTKCTK